MKSETAYRTTGEVAEDLDIPDRTIRFWTDRFPHVAPVIRGGYRYYSVHDVEMLLGLRALLHHRGYSIRGAENVIREKGAPFIRALGRGEITAF